jgi:hypothetical protein
MSYFNKIGKIVVKAVLNSVRRVEHQIKDSSCSIEEKEHRPVDLESG